MLNTVIVTLMALASLGEYTYISYSCNALWDYQIAIGYQDWKWQYFSGVMSF